MSERFVRQLEELHVELITMGSLCEKAISLSAKAIQGEGGMTLIGKIFETEKEIDAQEKEIENLQQNIESQQEYDDMLEELIDRFGEPTKAVLNLLAIARLKALAHQGYVTEIKQLGKDVRITLYEKAKLDPAGIPAIMAQYRRGLQFKADHEPKFILTPQGRLIEELMKFAGELAKLAEPLE